MTNATAIFQDTYFGATPMILTRFKTSSHGSKVVRFRWAPSPNAAPGCITTGIVATGFSTAARAIEVATRHPLFSNVNPTAPAVGRLVDFARHAT
jgi:hypothetical protein